MNRLSAAGRLTPAENLEAETHNIRGDLIVGGRINLRGRDITFDTGLHTINTAVGTKTASGAIQFSQDQGVGTLIYQPPILPLGLKPTNWNVLAAANTVPGGGDPPASWDDLVTTASVATVVSSAVSDGGFLTGIPAEYLTETEGDGRYITSIVTPASQSITSTVSNGVVTLNYSTPDLSGYLTAHQDLSTYLKTSDVPVTYGGSGSLNIRDIFAPSNPEPLHHEHFLRIVEANGVYEIDHRALPTVDWLSINHTFPLSNHSLGDPQIGYVWTVTQASVDEGKGEWRPASGGGITQTQMEGHLAANAYLKKSDADELYMKGINPINTAPSGIGGIVFTGPGGHYQGMGTLTYTPPDLSGYITPNDLGGYITSYVPAGTVPSNWNTLLTSSNVPSGTVPTNWTDLMSNITGSDQTGWHWDLGDDNSVYIPGGAAPSKWSDVVTGSPWTTQGYLTQHQDLSDYLTQQDLSDYLTDTANEAKYLVKTNGDVTQTVNSNLKLQIPGAGWRNLQCRHVTATGDVSANGKVIVDDIECPHVHSTTGQETGIHFGQLGNEDWAWVTNVQNGTGYAHRIHTSTGMVWSDERMKYKQRSVTNGLETIRQLRPTRYNKHTHILSTEERASLEGGGELVEDSVTVGGRSYKMSGAGVEEVGFVAQEVEKIPQLAHCVNGEPKQLRYFDLLAYSIQALKELDTLVQKQVVQISSQSRVIAKLEGRIQALENPST